MKKIAIVYVEKLEIYDDWEHSYERIVREHITEWQDISEEECKELRYAIDHLNSKTRRTGSCYIVIEFPKQKEFILETIDDYKEYSKNLKEEQEKKKKELDLKKAAKKLKLSVKTEQEKRDLLEQLKVELGYDQNKKD